MGFTIYIFQVAVLVAVSTQTTELFRRFREPLNPEMSSESKNLLKISVLIIALSYMQLSYGTWYIGWNSFLLLFYVARINPI